MSTCSIDSDVCIIEAASSAPSKESKEAFRAVIDDVRLSMLVASYNVHFAEYSETHSKSSQLIPNTVWKQVSSLLKINSTF